MLKKITLLAILIPGLALVQACCGDYYPYFSYSALTIREPFDPVSPNALLQPVKRFLIYPAAVQYLASAKPAINIGAALMAWSCNPDGDLGAKVPIERVEITSDQPFGQDYPAGAIINDFFAVYGENYDTYQPVPLDAWYDQQQFDYAPGYTSLLLLMPAAPVDTSLVHCFTFTFILADGTQASGVLEGVRFE
jgi:hypothetical protein